jgi:hypothetical protein
MMRAAFRSVLFLLATLAGCGGNDDVGPQCVQTGEHPIPRSETMGVLDAQRQRLVFFGGDIGVPANCSPAPQPYGELWTYDLACNSFEQAFPTGGPGPRARGAAAYDANGDRMLVFGGRYREGAIGLYTLYNEVWALDLETLTWQSIATTGTPPSARTSPAMVFDSAANQLLVFGGNVSANGAVFSPVADLWALDLATGAWRSIPPVGTPPPARLLHAAAFSSTSGRMYVYAGGDANSFTGAFFGDLWSVDPDTGAWSLELGPPSGGPRPRINPGLFFDDTRDRLVLFGGHDDGAVGNQNDVWAFDPAQKVWTNLVPPEVVESNPAGVCLFPADFTLPNLSAPDRRSSYLGAIDSSAGSIVIYGGKSDCGVIDDVWTFDLVTAQWRRDFEATTGETCLRGEQPDQCTTLCI